jgi:hypothetical protein
MECKPRHNIVDTPTLFWAGIPGNEADFPAEESFYTFIEQALCFFVEETNYQSSLSPFGIKMVDRLTGKPLHLDISDLPMKKDLSLLVIIIHCIPGNKIGRQHAPPATGRDKVEDFSKNGT